MNNPATDATPADPQESEATIPASDSPDPSIKIEATTENSGKPVTQTESPAVRSTVKDLTPKDLKTLNAISWLSVAMSFLPLIILVLVADGYDAIQRFNPTDSLFFPVVMFAISYIGSRYAKKTNNFVTKGLNAIFGTFYIFLLMLYFASGLFGLNAVLIIPMLLPVVLPVVFIWLLGIKVTLSKFRGNPVDENGNPVDPNTLDPMKATLPDKTFAEIVFQIVGVFLAIGLGFFITTGIISLL